MHLPGRYVDFRFSFSPERSSKARSALEQLFGDGKFGDGSLAQPEHTSYYTLELGNRMTFQKIINHFENIYQQQ